ncbi:LON peptidase substrate-binding domain-containing protein [Flammeovirgaceae bacterium SG7u.111]|nr:LON peptidase substrate-binding domain-containing protein [Flammeovirgaceae bacterium SG7u.132]WPO34288.1 LON peptidase substrate-binding domain-containing protein [Flammeovirgaceae bacterium SG7u.111]
MLIKLPLFPLKLVVFPNETLNLHVFEPRYKQLVNDCVESGATFGISTFLNNKVQAWGTEIRIHSITNTYKDGRMDISTKGDRIFRIENFKNPMDRQKLYAGGEIEFKEFTDEVSNERRAKLLKLLEVFFELIKIDIDVPVNDPFLSFRVGHKLGLSLRQEYQLLKTKSEGERIAVLIDHLEGNIPVVRAMEKAKDRIKKNGHFKNFDPINF